MLDVDVHHPGFGVPRAELPLVCAHYAVVGALDAASRGAPPTPDRDHTLLRVRGAVLPLFPHNAVRGRREAAFERAQLLVELHHTLLCVLNATPLLMCTR